MKVTVIMQDGQKVVHSYVDITVQENYLRVRKSDRYSHEAFCYPFFAIRGWEERDR